MVGPGRSRQKARFHDFFTIFHDFRFTILFLKNSRKPTGMYVDLASECSSMKYEEVCMFAFIR